MLGHLITSPITTIVCSFIRIANHCIYYLFKTLRFCRFRRQVRGGFYLVLLFQSVKTSLTAFLRIKKHLSQLIHSHESTLISSSFLD